MPRLCISLCALLLLPLTLSCGSKKPEKDIICGYKQIVETDLNRTTMRIAELLQNSNSSCSSKHKRPNCTSNTTNFGNIIIKLACKMKNLTTHTNYLARSVETSTNCPCGRDGRKRRKRESNRNLCKAMAFLSNMHKCYQLLYIKHGHQCRS